MLYQCNLWKWINVIEFHNFPEGSPGNVSTSHFVGGLVGSCHNSQNPGIRQMSG